MFIGKNQKGERYLSFPDHGLLSFRFYRCRADQTVTPKTQRPKSLTPKPQTMIAQVPKTFNLKKKGFIEAREVRQHNRVMREIGGK